MSLAVQEQVLLELLFDEGQRARFCRDAGALLEDYPLDAAERDDLLAIRPDALELDAKMRRDFILVHLCRAYPISFALMSSYPDGLALLKSLVNSRTVSGERSVVFGEQLLEAVPGLQVDSGHEAQLVAAIIQLELARSMVAAALRQHAMEQGEPAALPGPPSDWSSRPVRLADFVSACIVPLPFGELKQGLCSVADTALWQHLKQNPVPKSRRNALLQQEQPRLLVVRAFLKRYSACEPLVEHKTVELSDGFAHLFQHIDGNNSIDTILAQFQRAGADEKLLRGVRKGFEQLINNGMLRVA